jgi:hypothetical protein
MRRRHVGHRDELRQPHRLIEMLLHVFDTLHHLLPGIGRVSRVMVAPPDRGTQQMSDGARGVHQVRSGVSMFQCTERLLEQREPLGIVGQRQHWIFRGHAELREHRGDFVTRGVKPGNGPGIPLGRAIGMRLAGWNHQQRAGGDFMSPAT